MESSSSSQQPRVLIVEPNRKYLSVLARRIAEGGFRVATAETAEGAMAELHRMPADLVLAELRMPGTDGVELVRMMRQDISLQEIPIFLLTGRSDRRGAVAAYQSGADTVIAKPFHFEVLSARIAREIARSDALQRLRSDNAALDARVAGRAIELGEMRARWLEAERERKRLQDAIKARP